MLIDMKKMTLRALLLLLVILMVVPFAGCRLGGRTAINSSWRKKRILRKQPPSADRQRAALFIPVASPQKICASRKKQLTFSSKWVTINIYAIF